MSVLGMNNNNDISITGLVNLTADNIDTTNLILNGSDLDARITANEEAIDEIEVELENVAYKNTNNVFTMSNTFQGISATTINGVNANFFDVTSSIQTQLNSKAGFTTNNNFTGINTFKRDGTSACIKGTQIDSNVGGAFQFIANAHQNDAYNVTSRVNDTLLVFYKNGYIDNDAALNITAWSSIPNGIRLKDTLIEMNTADISFNGNIHITSGKTLNGISTTTLSYLNGVTSSIQSQIDSKENNNSTNINVSRLADGTISNTEFQTLNNISSNIQNQLNTKENNNSVNIDVSRLADGTISNTEFQTLNNISSNIQNQINSRVGLTLNNNITGNNTLSGNNVFSGPGMYTHANNFTQRIQQQIGTSLNTSFGFNCMNLSTGTNIENSAFGNACLPNCTTASYQNSGLGSQSLLSLTSGKKNSCIGHFSGGLITTGDSNTCLGQNSGNNITYERDNICIGVDTTITAGNLNSIVIGNSAQCTAGNQIRLGTSSHNVSIPGNLMGVSAAFYDPTSSIQTQLNSKESSTSTAINANRIANGSVSNTEFQYLDGVTSSIQSQINSKANLSSLGSTLIFSWSNFSPVDSVSTTLTPGFSLENSAMYLGFCSFIVTKNNGSYDSNGKIQLSWSESNTSLWFNDFSTFYTAQASAMDDIGVQWPPILFTTYPAYSVPEVKPVYYFEYDNLNAMTCTINLKFIRIK